MKAAKSCDPLRLVPLNFNTLSLHPKFVSVICLSSGHSFLSIRDLGIWLTDFYSTPCLFVVTHSQPLIPPLGFWHSHRQWASLLFFISRSPTHRSYLGPYEQKRAYILSFQPFLGKWFCHHFLPNYLTQQVHNRKVSIYWAPTKCQAQWWTRWTELLEL